MKTNIIFIIALACIAALSCAKEIDNPSAPASSTNVFTAEKAEFEVPAKSTLQGKKSIWEADDEIAVYADGAAAVKFTTESEGASVQFKSETEVTGSSFLFAYPYDAAKGVQDGKLLLTIPSEQTARTGSFDPHAALSAASATDLTKAVKFKNVLALLKFNIPAELDGKISSITVESKGGEAIAGDILLNVEDKTNEVSTNGSYSVSLSTEQLSQGYYYIAVRPCVLPSGIRVLAWTTDGKNAYVKESKACEFSVNTIYDMGEVAVESWKLATVNTGQTVKAAAWTDWGYSCKPARYDFYIDSFSGDFTFFWIMKECGKIKDDGSGYNNAEFRYHVKTGNTDISVSPWCGDAKAVARAVDGTKRNVFSIHVHPCSDNDGNVWTQCDWILNGETIYSVVCDGKISTGGADDVKISYDLAVEKGARYQFKASEDKPMTISKWVCTAN